MRVALVVSTYHDFVTARLEAGARRALRESGLADADIVTIAVPGAYELAQAASRLAVTSDWHGIVCLGCLIRGETPHFDYIAQAAAHGIIRVAQDTGVPSASACSRRTPRRKRSRVPATDPATRGARRPWPCSRWPRCTPDSTGRRHRRHAMSSPRHQAREAALKALYLWEVGRTEPARAVDTYFEEHQPEAEDAVRDFARALVLGTAGDVAALDAAIQQHSQHWRIERLAIIDRLILRMAIWELQPRIRHPGRRRHQRGA